MPIEDDELFDLIGAIGAAGEARRDEDLSSVVREVASGLEEKAANRLADLNRSAATGDDSSDDDHL